MKIAIVTNGQINDLNFVAEILLMSQYIICADGAAKYLMDLNIIPDQLVGDLDSIEEYVLSWIQEQGVPISRFPSQKDQTDTELAVELALQQNPSEILILGAMGSRMDHSLANALLLVKIMERGILGRILDENNEMKVIKEYIKESGNPGDNISVLPIGGVAKGVTLRGVMYPLNHKDIPMGSSLGISNQFVEKYVEISIVEGLLLVIKSRD